MGTGVGDMEFQSHIANIRRTGWLPGTAARLLSTTFLYGRFGCRRTLARVQPLTYSDSYAPEPVSSRYDALTRYKKQEAQEPVAPLAIDWESQNSDR